ncbi:MAG: hypothetical protein M5U34_20785 [Chloroflexi bacterium]|nr:hypothetical protein [Chloroflexota bacterium]
MYPSLAQGIIREGQAAAGRVWLLLRYLDENGRGWVTEFEAQMHLTTKTSPTRIFGKRQWRNIIKKGDGIFWQRENGRLWLNSVGKTAAALGVWQLNGQPVKAAGVGTDRQDRHSTRPSLCCVPQQPHSGTLRRPATVETDCPRQFERPLQYIPAHTTQL